MLPGRKHFLIMIYETYQKLQIPLLYQKGKGFGECSRTDDPGFFLYVPLLSSFFNISALQGAQLFTLLLCITMFCSFSVLSIALGRSWLISGVIILWILPLIFKLSTICDVYIVSAGVFVPLAFFIVAINKKSKNWLYVSGFLVGVFGSGSNLVRSYSALPVFVFFLIILFFCNEFLKKHKAIALMCLLVGYLIPFLHYSYALHKKNTFLISQGVAFTNDSRHVFWHNIYIGLGFIRNNYGIRWEDGCAQSAIKKVDSSCGVGSKQGEEITKRLIFNLFKKDRHFFLTSLFARFGVVIMFFFVWFGWFGLLCSYFFPKPWYEEVAFMITLGISSLPGLLTIPRFEYLTGFVTCTVLYVIYSLIYALKKNNLKIIK
jgi:hypothetical protein